MHKLSRVISQIVITIRDSIWLQPWRCRLFTESRTRTVNCIKKGTAERKERKSYGVTESCHERLWSPVFFFVFLGGWRGCTDACWEAQALFSLWVRARWILKLKSFATQQRTEPPLHKIKVPIKSTRSIPLFSHQIWEKEMQCVCDDLHISTWPIIFFTPPPPPTPFSHSWTSAENSQNHSETADMNRRLTTLWGRMKRKIKSRHDERGRSRRSENLRGEESSSV